MVTRASSSNSAGAAGQSRGVLLSTSASAVSVAVSLCSVFYNELGRMPEMGQPSRAAMLEAKAPRVMETADVDAERSGVRRYVVRGLPRCGRGLERSGRQLAACHAPCPPVQLRSAR